MAHFRVTHLFNGTLRQTKNFFFYEKWNSLIIFQLNYKLLSAVDFISWLLFIIRQTFSSFFVAVCLINMAVSFTASRSYTYLEQSSSIICSSAVVQHLFFPFVIILMSKLKNWMKTCILSFIKVRKNCLVLLQYCQTRVIVTSINTLINTTNNVISNIEKQ